MVGFLHNSRVLGFSGFTESMMNNYPCKISYSFHWDLKGKALSNSLVNHWQKISSVSGGHLHIIK